MAFEAVAYENDKERAYELLEILKTAGIKDGVAKYDSIAQCHRIYVPSGDFPLAKNIVESWYDGQEESNDKDAIYSSTDDKYKDNLSSAWTFLVCGFAGLIFTVVYDLGMIPIFSMNMASKILFNVVTILLFLGFIIIGTLSMRYSRQIKLELDVNKSKNDEIMDYLLEELTLEKIDSTFDSDGLPREMYYFKRCEAIKAAITEKFGTQNEEFINTVCDEFLEKIEG